MAWHGYFFLELTGGQSTENKVALRDAILDLGSADPTRINHVPHLKPRLDEEACIGEVYLSNVVTTTQVIQKLANKMGVTYQTAANNIKTFALSPGDSWQERREATIAWLTNPVRRDEWYASE